MAQAIVILCKGLALGKGVVAYSGGKDGLAVALLARDLGVNIGVCELSYTFTEQEKNIRATANLLGFTEVVWRKKLSISWLARRPQYVFCRDRRYNEFCQHKHRSSVEDWAKLNGYPVVITGRKSKGNMVKAPIYSLKNGTIGCHPLKDWDDGDIWAFLRDRGVARPWIYSTRLGQTLGNGVWPSFHDFPDRQANYRVIYDIEPAVVHEAALVDVAGAREFLSTM
jgi:3'-phosphoadenosine 5'-phosphosulfate sulfotransferase (PAPS reductase)/FAD synthetase